MKTIFFISGLFLSSLLFSQPISTLKKRFDTYLNFNASLNSLVSFTDHSVSILHMGKPEFTIFEDEQIVIVQLLEHLNPADFLAIYIWKKNKHLSKLQLDSLKTYHAIFEAFINQRDLKGKRVAIDPGHFSGNVTDARVEQKFIHFIPGPLTNLKDTIHFNEGALTYQTAYILKNKLQEQGAIVMMTRPEQNYTSFQMSYNDWFSKRKKQVLDSLLNEKTLDTKRYSLLMKQSKEQLFWSFFRDFELMERSRRINEFKPDITIIIHYNVDEKNTDWVKPTSKNYTMAFIGGAITSDNFSKPINKVHFLRLLLTNQLNESEKLSSLTVNQFNSQLKIPIAQKQDADYLYNNCIKAPSNGVFCRNLALCRTINSPLVYGEALYQDNINECLSLNTPNCDMYSLKISRRVYDVAMCYYNAIHQYFSE